MEAAAQTGFLTPERLMKLGVALMFDLLKGIFGLFFITLPLIACGAVGAYILAKTDSSWLAGLSCVASGVTVGAAEYLTGVGAVAVEMAGMALAMAVDFMAGIVFAIWFLTSGINFFSGKRASSRFLTSMAGFCAGLVPFVNLAPTITITVAAIEWQHYLELKEKAAKQGQETQARQAMIMAQQEAYQQRRISEMQMRAANDNAAAEAPAAPKAA